MPNGDSKWGLGKIVIVAGLCGTLLAIAGALLRFGGTSAVLCERVSVGEAVDIQHNVRLHDLRSDVDRHDESIGWIRETLPRLEAKIDRLLAE